MADEAAIVELLGNGGDPISYTVADGVAVAKGSLMVLKGDRTIQVGSSDGDLFVGIATAEKVASDGTTTLAVYTNGIFDIMDQGPGMTLGVPAKIGTLPNRIVTADEAGVPYLTEMVGIVLETATGSEVVQVRVLK